MRPEIAETQLQFGSFLIAGDDWYSYQYPEESMYDRCTVDCNLNTAPHSDALFEPLATALDPAAASPAPATTPC